MTAFFFPWPDSRLSPNGTRNPRLRARLTAQARARAAEVANQHGINPIRSGTVSRMTYHPPSARWDQDNVRAMGKATLDGLADAMGANDRDFRPEVAIGAPQRGGAIVIEIEGIPAD